MGRKPRVDRTPEQKWEIVQEVIKSGNISEACRRHGISPTLFYRWRDEAEQGAKAALGGRSAAAAETEKDRRIRQLERTLGAEVAGDRDPKKRRGGVSCGEVHSQARELVAQGQTATLVADDVGDQPVEFVLPEACHEAAGPTERTMSRSWWRAERNWRTATGAWRGGCGRKEGLRDEWQTCACG
jgi:transposase-like protein